jgi:hypothetical protein
VLSAVEAVAEHPGGPAADAQTEAALNVVIVDLRFAAGGEPLGDAVGQMHAAAPRGMLVGSH